MTSPTKRPPEAFMAANLFEQGMGHVLVSRFKSQGRVESGVFLLDTYCLGVKDAFFTLTSESEYEQKLVDRVFANVGRESLEPSCARKLIEDAVAYAQNLGFAPHRDFKGAARVLGGISASDCTRSFRFGMEGKPHFIQGPHDSEEKCQRILKVLEARCGPGNFHFTILSPGFGDFGLDP